MTSEAGHPNTYLNAPHPGESCPVLRKPHCSHLTCISTGCPSANTSVAPPLGDQTAHTRQITEPFLVNGSTNLQNDRGSYTILSLSTNSRPDIVIPPSQHTTPERCSELLSAATEGSYDDLETPLSDEVPSRTGRVRFRSRVRITSGLNRRKQKSRSEHDYMTFSSSSSISGSPSSSISAPLRTHEDGLGKPGWGTLGQRVSMFVRANSQRTKPREQRGRISTTGKTQSCTRGGYNTINERTPLNGIGQATDNESDFSREIDLVFGPWPKRLLNQHWWWWHFEPLVCCHCLVETDDEG